MLTLVIYAIPYVLGAIFLLATYNLYLNYRRTRKAPYFRIRREAARAGWRWLMIMLASVVGIVMGLNSRRAVPPLDLGLFQPATPEPEVTQTFSISNLSSATSDPSIATKDPLAAPPTITPTQPTPTLSPTPYIATIESQVTPSADASIRITDISSGISASLQPVNADTSFPVGTPRLYIWIEYSDMVDGVSWSRVLLLDGNVVRTESEAWERGGEGVAYYFFDAPSGWPAGSYEVQFYVGDQLADSRDFDVIN